MLKAILLFSTLWALSNVFTLILLGLFFHIEMDNVKMRFRKWWW